MPKQLSNRSEKLFSDIKKYGPINGNSDVKDFERRKYFTNYYAWAVPNKTAIKKIKKFSKNEKIC